MIFFLRATTFGLLALAACAPARSDGTPRRPPNVVIVMTDDQGYGELSCHGNPYLRTPNLDALAAAALRLSDFHVAPMCTPTRGQLMTGYHAMRNGAMNVSSGRTLLRPEMRTMADYFKGAGYRTGIFGKWHLGDNYPFRPEDRGFDETLWFPSSHVNSVPDAWDNDYFDDVYVRNGRRSRVEGYCTDVFFREAIRWMRSAPGPFLAYVPLNAPHGPLWVPDRYRGPIREAIAADPGPAAGLAPGARENLVSYLAMCANVDENMGNLDDFLRQAGLLDDTIVVFLTDNGSTMGESYYNAGMRGRKVSLWEGGHRVPCFLRWPAGTLRPPGELAPLTQVQDLLPTLAELCGVRGLPGDLEGRSLAPLLRGRPQPELDDRVLFINFSRQPVGADTYRPDNPAVPRRDGAAVLWKRWRLLEDRALYDLAGDPHQDADVAARHPEVVARLRGELARWWEGVSGTVNERQRIVIGNDAENPMTLTACEWWDVFVDQQRQVRAGELKNGTWHLRVDRPGRYRFTARRWPAESGLALSAAAPETKIADGRLVAGKALPIRGGRLRIRGEEQRRDAEAGAKAVEFVVELAAGDVELQAEWLDDQGRLLCGAYYVEVRRE